MLLRNLQGGHFYWDTVYMYLQYFDTVGWVFWPVKTVPI